MRLNDTTILFYYKRKERRKLRLGNKRVLTGSKGCHFYLQLLVINYQGHYDKEKKLPDPNENPLYFLQHSSPKEVTGEHHFSSAAFSSWEARYKMGGGKVGKHHYKNF